MLTSLTCSRGTGEFGLRTSRQNQAVVTHLPVLQEIQSDLDVLQLVETHSAFLPRLQETEHGQIQPIRRQSSGVSGESMTVDEKCLTLISDDVTDDVTDDNSSLVKLESSTVTETKG